MNRNKILLVCFLAYAGIGLTAGIFGVLIPSIRAEFSITLDQVGWLFLFTSIGFFIASIASGTITARFGIVAILIAGHLMMALGLAGNAFAPNWTLFIASGMGRGFGMGLMDAGLNAYAARHFNARILNGLHAGFALGATISPLLGAAWLDSGGDWQWTLLALAGEIALLAGAIFLTRSGWESLEKREANLTHSNSAPFSATLRLWMAWLSIVLFFLYAGMEGVVGQWGYSLLTEERGVGLQLAGIWVSIYWGGLLAGRLLMVALAHRWHSRQILRFCLAISTIGAFLLWQPYSLTLNYISLALLGMAFGPLYPTLTSETSSRVGGNHTPNMIGLQVGAADAGFGALPAFAGVLAEATSLQIIGGLLILLCLLMWVLYEYLLRHSQNVSDRRAGNPT